MNQVAAKRQVSQDTIRIAAFNGNGSAGEWEIKKELLTIGRISTNDVCLNDKKVSRTHCTVELRPEGLFLKDGGSSNGTWVNGQKVSEVLLKDLEVDSPYNTYRNKGLPPGPICSPGRAAFHAVLFPLPDSTELYFVARGDGTHIFSRSWEEHLAAIAHVRAVTRAESTTATLVGPMPEPPRLQAAPDSVTRRETLVNAMGPKPEPPSKATGKAVTSKKGTTKTVTRKTTSKAATRKEPAPQAGPTSPTTKHKKRSAVKS